MDEDTNRESRLFSTVSRAVRTLRETLENRIELFLLEAKEDRLRLFDALCLAVVAVVLAVMTMVLATFTIVVIFWDTHRLLALAIITLAYAAGATATFIRLRTRLKKWHSFQATLEELQKDRACFKEKN
jgi:uncharacterized membrane protein YqjE